VHIACENKHGIVLLLIEAKMHVEIQEYRNSYYDGKSQNQLLGIRTKGVNSVQMMRVGFPLFLVCPSVISSFPISHFLQSFSWYFSLSACCRAVLMHIKRNKNDYRLQCDRIAYIRHPKSSRNTCVHRSLCFWYSLKYPILHVSCDFSTTLLYNYYLLVVIYFSFVQER